MNELVKIEYRVAQVQLGTLRCAGRQAAVGRAEKKWMAGWLSLVSVGSRAIVKQLTTHTHTHTQLAAFSRWPIVVRDICLY